MACCSLQDNDTGYLGSREWVVGEAVTPQWLQRYKNRNNWSRHVQTWNRHRDQTRVLYLPLCWLSRPVHRTSTAGTTCKQPWGRLTAGADTSHAEPAACSGTLRPLAPSRGGRQCEVCTASKPRVPLPEEIYTLGA